MKDKQTLPHQLAVVAHEEYYAPGCLDSPMSTRHFATIKENENDENSAAVSKWMQIWESKFFCYTFSLRNCGNHKGQGLWQKQARYTYLQNEKESTEKNSLWLCQDWSNYAHAKILNKIAKTRSRAKLNSKIPVYLTLVVAFVFGLFLRLGLGDWLF